MTTADIPPGGEGKIEVSFDSNHKSGAQNKTITVTSNDPREPTTRLQIAVFVDVEFGFSPTSIGFGRVYRGQAVSKTAKLLIKYPERNQIASLTSSSDFVQARIVDDNPGEASEGVIPIEVTLAPDCPPGTINEFVTATPTDTSLPESKLRVAGSVIGDVEVTPEMVSFMVQSEDTLKVTPMTRKVTILNRNKSRALKISNVSDAQDRLNLKLNTVEEGQKYELSVSPKVAGSKPGNVSGNIVISTDNPDQRTVSIRYSIYHRK